MGFIVGVVLILGPVSLLVLVYCSGGFIVVKFIVGASFIVGSKILFGCFISGVFIVWDSWLGLFHCWDEVIVGARSMLIRCHCCMEFIVVVGFIVGPGSLMVTVHFWGGFFFVMLIAGVSAEIVCVVSL